MLLGEIDTSSKTPENVNEMVDKLLRETLPRVFNTLRDLSTNTSIMTRDFLNLQSSAYRIVSDCNVKLGTTCKHFENSIQKHHLLMGRDVNTLNLTLTEFNKLVFNFNVDFRVANKLLKNDENKLHRTHGDFEK
jgi:hypothetical protein